MPGGRRAWCGRASPRGPFRHNAFGLLGLEAIDAGHAGEPHPPGLRPRRQPAAGGGLHGTRRLREYIWLNGRPLALYDDVQTGAPTRRYVHVDHLEPPGDADHGRQVCRLAGDLQRLRRGAHHHRQRDAGCTVPRPVVPDGNGAALQLAQVVRPELGRYTQPDPLGLEAMLADGPSRFVYALGSPLMFFDVMGLLSGAEIVAAANSYVGTGSHSFWRPAGQPGGGFPPYPPGTNKCNIFIAQVMDDVGNPMSAPQNGIYPDYPSAATWGDPTASIPGWRPVPTNALRPGDVIGNGAHVGFVSGNRMTTSASTARGAVSNNWGFRPGPEDNATAAWRCECVNE